jgi:hypothetical protein
MVTIQSIAYCVANSVAESLEWKQWLKGGKLSTPIYLSSL